MIGLPNQKRERAGEHSYVGTTRGEWINETHILFVYNSGKEKKISYTVQDQDHFQINGKTKKRWEEGKNFISISKNQCIVRWINGDDHETIKQREFHIVIEVVKIENVTYQNMKFNMFLDHNRSSSSRYWWIHGLLGQTGQKEYRFDSQQQQHLIQGKAEDYQVSEKYAYDFLYNNNKIATKNKKGKLLFTKDPK